MMKKPIGQLTEFIEDNSVKEPLKVGYNAKTELWQSTDKPKPLSETFAKNLRKITLPREKARGIDILDVDKTRRATGGDYSVENLDKFVIEKDTEEYRKKKSKKPKTKRTTKKCRCK
jgi:hypothetical protein